jgi:hypothetical protein
MSIVKEEQFDEVFPQKPIPSARFFIISRLLKLTIFMLKSCSRIIVISGVSGFLFGDRDEQKHLWVVRSWKLGQYLELLDKVREHLMHTLSEITLEDFRRVRVLPDYDMSPEYVCLYLLQHETSYLGQIQSLLHVSV